MAHLSAVEARILPHSLTQSLPGAFSEWRFTGDVIDHGKAIETCHLCGQQDLRYHFQIRNLRTDHMMWVGSHCILKFSIEVLGPDGVPLSPEEASRELSKAVDRKKREKCLVALLELSKRTMTGSNRQVFEMYRDGEALFPETALRVFQAFRTHSIPYEPSDFEVSLRTSSCWFFLEKTGPNDLALLWPALTPAQRISARKAKISLESKLAREAERMAELAAQREVDKLRYEAEQRMYEAYNAQIEAEQKAARKAFWENLEAENKAKRAQVIALAEDRQRKREEARQRKREEARRLSQAAAEEFAQSIEIDESWVPKPSKVKKPIADVNDLLGGMDLG